MKVPYTNETNKHLHIGPVTIAPGHTRDVEESHIPGYKPKDAKQESAPIVDLMTELLKKSVKDITAELPFLSTAYIERLGELEQKEDQPRKTLLSAISEEILNRAADEQLAAIAAMSNEVLAAAIAEAGTDININPDYLMALEAEYSKRNQSGAA
jgi:hypothetical protein